MQLLPLVEPGSGYAAVVPISDTSAIVLARVLLEGQEATPASAALLGELKGQLLDDPPLAVWALKNAQARGTSSPMELDAIARWLHQNASSLLGAILLMGDTSAGDSGSEAGCSASAGGPGAEHQGGEAAASLSQERVWAERFQRLADLVAQRVALAELVARLAAEKSPLEPELAEQARLAALVISPEDWNLSPTRGGEGGLRIPDSAVSLVVEGLGILAGQSLTNGQHPGAQALTCRAAEARNKWLTSIPGTAGLLPALADRLAALDRLQHMEREYSARLEREKLDALAEFAAGAGHEINNPLANISGRAQMLLRSEADPERRRELATIAAQAQRAHQMIADLWLFARPPQPERRRIDLVDVAERAVAEFAPWAAEQSIELVRTGRGDSLWVQADPVQLQVAVGALVANAIEAVGSGGRIEVAVECLGQEAGIRVTDTGPGIPAEHRPHLFDPFFSGRQAGRGLGLGLSKAWRIARSHGGRLEVADTLCGASLAMMLPVGSSGGAEESRP